MDFRTPVIHPKKIRRNDRDFSSFKTKILTGKFIFWYQKLHKIFI
jgi:hypothetical protein